MASKETIKSLSEVRRNVKEAQMCANYLEKTYTNIDLDILHLIDAALSKSIISLNSLINQ